MTDNPSLPLIEHEFVPCIHRIDECDYPIGNGLCCAQPRAAHRAEPPTITAADRWATAPRHERAEPPTAEPKHSADCRENPWVANPYDCPACSKVLKARGYVEAAEPSRESKADEVSWPSPESLSFETSDYLNFTREPSRESIKDVHTEHCCERHGCKYWSDCPVEKRAEPSSGPCELCYSDAEDDEEIARFANDLLEARDSAIRRERDREIEELRGELKRLEAELDAEYDAEAKVAEQAQRIEQLRAAYTPLAADLAPGGGPEQALAALHALKVQLAEANQRAEQVRAVLVEPMWDGKALFMPNEVGLDLAPRVIEALSKAHAEAAEQRERAERARVKGGAE